MPITRVALVAAAAAAAQNCSRVVRVGTFDQATPYALAPATRWLEDDRACFAYYRQPSGARALGRRRDRRRGLLGRVLRAFADHAARQAEDAGPSARRRGDGGALGLSYF